MNSAPSSAATSLSGGNPPPTPPSPVPTSTGATAAGSVRGRAAISQILIPPGIDAAAEAAISATSEPTRPLGSPRELREVSRTLLQIGVPALLGLLAHVEEQVGVVGQLLNPGQAILVGVEARLQIGRAACRERV